MQKIGKTLGVVWTPDGSHLIQIGAKVRRGSGKVLIDGDIGHDFLVSVENIIILFGNLNIDLSCHNIALNIPTRIDGPSAGLALFVAIHSAIKKTPVNPCIAFTGEVNQDGVVMGVGDIVDKITAARRANLDSIVMPIDNLVDLPAHVNDTPWKGLALCPVGRVLDALVVATP